MTRLHFEKSIKKLEDKLKEMSEVAIKQIDASVKAFIEKDIHASEQIIKDDDIVDKIEKEIDDYCIKLIATEQPLASDLRNIFSIIKIVTDVERIADYAVDISKINLYTKDEDYLWDSDNINSMCEITINMLRKAIDAFINEDLSKSYEICKMDDKVDELYLDMLLKANGEKDIDKVKQGTRFLFICKYLERAADHVTNICESTIFLISGDTVDLNE